MENLEGVLFLKGIKRHFLGRVSDALQKHKDCVRHLLKLFHKIMEPQNNKYKRTSGGLLVPLPKMRYHSVSEQLLPVFGHPICEHFLPYLQL